MAIPDQIEKAINILLSHQNSDGGLPATKPLDDSGGWTTAEALEAFLQCAYFPKEKVKALLGMTLFLIDSQHEDGSWALVSGPRGSTLSTGHTIATLQLALDAFESEAVLCERLRQAISRGFTWLEKYQNSDGGWGVEPTSGGRDGVASRVAGTYYALRTFWIRGGSLENSRVVRNAIDHLVRLRRPDGSWGYVAGAPGSVSNTARAIIALIRSGYCTPDSPTARSAIDFILKEKPDKYLWDLETEGFLPSQPSAYGVYNNHTQYDALEALVRTGCTKPAVQECMTWFLEHQEDDGFYYLSRPFPFRKTPDICMWSTAEWIYILDLASGVFSRRAVLESGSSPRSLWIAALAVLSLIALSELLLILQVPQRLVVQWRSLPEETREIVLLICFAFALVANLLSRRLVRLLKLILHKVRLRSAA